MEEESEEMVDKCINSEQAESLDRQLYFAVFFQDFVKFEKLLSHLPEEFDVDFVIDCEREENSLVLLSCAKPVKFIRLLTERGANLFITTPSKKNALHIACEYGRLDVVKFLVENVKDKLDFVVESLDGRTVLHYALRAEQNQEEIINYLKSNAKLNVNRLLSSGSTVLLDTVSACDIETTKILCRHGADPNLGMSGTYKAIHIASQQPDNAKMIQLLLDHGANKDELWRHGQRPIHLAIKHGLTNNVSSLLQVGSTFNCRIKLHNRKYRKISTVCLMAWKCPTLVPNLLNRGANPNDTHSPSGSTVLGFVLENSRNAELIESVIRLGADPKGSHRGNPVVNYCQTLDQCLVFLEHGIPLESIEKGIGKSLLRLAIARIEYENEKTIEKRIQALLSQGAKLHGTPKYAKSELMIAINRRFFRIADYFIALGADLNHVDGSENTALHIICEQNHLWTKRDRDTYFKNFIRKMKKAGVAFNATNEEGMTPLLCHLNGSTNPDVSIFRLLISCGADIYALHPSSKKSILAHAIQNTETEILDVVLETQYDVNKLECNGEPPILSCISLDSSYKRQVFKKLLQRGASANVRDSEGTSLLEHVLHLKRISMLMQPGFLFMGTIYKSNPDPVMEDLLNPLINGGADINAVGKDGNTPLFTAIKEETFSAAKRLIEEGADVNRIGANNMTSFECCFDLYLKILENRILDSVTKKELECSATLKDIVDAGFRLDVPLSNGLFPLEMVCKHTYTDILLLIMIKSVMDSHVFFPRGESLLFCLLDKHPLTIRTFIGRNVHLPLKTKNGRSAFDIYTEMTFYDANCGYYDRLIPGHNKCLDIFFYRAKLSMRKSNPSLPIFKEPYEVKLGRTVDVINKEELSMRNSTSFLQMFKRLNEIERTVGGINKEEVLSMLPKYKALTELDVIEFEDEQSMLDALDLNETVLKNRPEHLYFVNKDLIEPVFYDISNAMDECCSAMEDLIEYEHVSVNDMLSWGIYPICVAVRLRSPALVRFMLDKGADPNVMDSWSETPLSLSIMLQHPEIIRLLVAAKANVNHMGSIMSIHNSPRQSLLSRSLKSLNQVSKGRYDRPNSLDIIKTLVDNGANVNGDQEKVDSALIEAVRMQDVEIVKFLLEHGANGKHQGMQGFTALHVLFMDPAHTHDFKNIMKALLEHRADINVKADNGETPFHVFLRQKGPIIQNFITPDLNPNETDNEGISYLMLAVDQGAVDVCQELLNIGADCSLLDSKGNSALHYACSSKFNIKLLEILLENGCDINLLNNDGHAPINVYLDKNNNAESFSVFLKNGADPNMCKENCKSPLIIAIERKGLDDVVDDLLERGANVNYRGPSEITALHVALEQVYSVNSWPSSNKRREENAEETRREKLVDQLLQAGADVNALTSDGITPLAVLLRNKQWIYEDTERLLSKLLECNADPNIGENPPLCFATETLNILIIKKLLESGAEINKPNKEWKSPLSCCLHSHRADDSQILPVVEFLVDNGSLVNSKEDLDSPLHYAVSKKFTKTAAFLIDKGANINHIGSSQLTPLLVYNWDDDHYWRKPDDETDLLKSLLLHNANPNVEDLEGNSPLNIALSRKASIQEIQCLLKAGADPLHKGKDNANAYEQALVKDWAYLDILFKECGSDHITNDFCCMFWKKVFEWNKKKQYIYSYDKQQSSYITFIQVSLSILASKEDIDVNVTIGEGKTPLIIYSGLNENTVVSRLLERGADVNHVDGNGQNALHALFSSQDDGSKRETIELLVKQGCDFYTKDGNGESVFAQTKREYNSLSRHYSRRGKPREFLLSFLNSAKLLEDLNSLLFGAAKQGDFTVINQLIQMGADCAAKSDLGIGIMHSCLQNTSVETPLKECLDCIKTYRNYGGLLAEIDTSNNTLILLFLCSELFPLGNNNESEFEEIMELLAINKGIVNIKNSSGLTPMLKAAYLGSYKCVTMLWRKGAKLNSRDSKGNTPLHAVLSKVAIPSDVYNNVMFCVDKGVDVNSKNCSEETPLYLALGKIRDKNIRLNVVKLLLSKGANPNVGRNECLPLVKALQLHDVASTIQLLQHGAKTVIQDVNRFSSVLKYLMQDYYYGQQNNELGDISKIIVVINERKNNINTTISGKSILQLAVLKFRHHEKITDLIRVILDLGADVNAKNSTRNSALSDVLSFDLDTNSAAVGELLLENGANPNGEFLLSKMLEEMKSRYRFDLYKRLAEKLLDHGADPNLYGKKTPNLILAVRTRDISTVKRLIEKGANVKEQDCDGTTSLHTAVSSDYENSEHRKKMVSLLLSHQVNICTKNRIGENALLLEIKKMVGEIKNQRPTDGILIVDLSVFNALICGGSDFVQARQRMSFDGDLGTSPLVMLMKVGMFRASTTLLMCGYPSDKDQELEKFDMSQYDWSSFDGYRRYKRINYEIDLRNLETTIENAKSEEIQPLVVKCREAIRNHILCCTQGADIESKMLLLPIPQTLKSFLSLREYTFEEEIIELMDSTTNNYDESNRSTDDDSEDYDYDEYDYPCYDDDDDDYCLYDMFY